jgi:hypothetical protein
VHGVDPFATGVAEVFGSDGINLGAVVHGKQYQRYVIG